MPRAKPDEISVIRLELGGWERERIKDAFFVTSAGILLPAVGVLALGTGVGLAGFTLYQWLKDAPFEPLSDAIDGVKDFLTPSPDHSVPIVNYTPDMDPTGQGRGFWETTWDNLWGIKFRAPWDLEPLPEREN